ncbi:nuclear transport factor 2B [Eucalyptus grandis]|uniref:Uncharacterized protein n=2 Tax=Eucalyptus grandis TaxID=71139 RepID=A0ACC3JWX0_EUCGR|nr:nuclear transport factor 2B [Eucalyptus grandis]KAK3418262.1 hypothetical protein EUGRSUZ_H04214 [Eucalyptus grandis]
MERIPNVEVLEGEMRRISLATTTIGREEMDLRMAAAKQFVEDYYKTFDTNRADLVNLYREESFVLFAGQKIQGKEGIVAKLTSIQQCRYQITNLNCIPGVVPVGVLVVVAGYMWLDGKPDALVFSHTFHLMPAPEGSFYVAQQLWMTCAFNQPRTPLASPVFPLASRMSRMSLV